MTVRVIVLALYTICVSSFSYGDQRPSADPVTEHPDLTPFGALKSGNESGTIPSWSGDETTHSLKQEKPLYVVTSQNQKQYAAQLNEGQIALLNTYPDSYRVPVYPSHRTAAAPEWVYRNTIANRQSAKLVNGGNGIHSAYGGIPFSIPTDETGQYDAQKIVWNHLARWRGISLQFSSSEAAVKANGSYSLISSDFMVTFPFYYPEGSFKDANNVLSYFIASIRKPARLAGGSVLVHETLDRTLEPRQAWVYSAGTRRVRRAPSVAYDMPVAGSDNLLTADNVDMFNGALDRYHWHFVEKRELLIPYNNILLSSHASDHRNLIEKGHINPDLTRYELHRVWVIEARLKPEFRHIYIKRRFYLDEDSWNIVQADQYDVRGNLWRVQLAYLMNYEHVPVTWSALTANYDLQSKRYFAGFLDNSNGIALKFNDEVPPKSQFKPQALRRMGR